MIARLARVEAQLAGIAASQSAQADALQRLALH